MKNEIYIWVIFIIAVLLAGLYVRYFYQPEISIVLGINGNIPQQLYPYQKVALNINAFNNGSNAITNMSLGVNVNGNLTTLYKISLPAGKQVTIAYNYSPTKAGIYSISVIADPGKLYNVLNRAQAAAKYAFSVGAAQNATPYITLPSENMTALKQANLTSGGYLLDSFIADQYNITRFSLSRIPQANRFLEPVLNLTAYYIKNITAAEAKYSDNSSASSIWIKGYLSPSIFSIATVGSGLRTTQANTSAGNTTYITLDGSSTLCSWYSGGWIKILAAANGKNCILILNQNKTAATPPQDNVLAENFSDKLIIPNASFLGSYSFSSNSGSYLARMSLITNSSFVYDSVSDVPGIQNATCFGLIYTLGNVTYCSTFVYPNSQRIGNLSLIRTTAYKGPYNLTAYSVVNTSYAIRQSAVAALILQGLNATGKPYSFKSGLTARCGFNQSFTCSDLAYLNGTVSFKITNNMNETAKLNGLWCYLGGGGTIPFPENVTLASGSSTNLAVSCYNRGVRISGPAWSLTLSLTLNYTSANSSRLSSGFAYIPFG